jgi:hypothetical protein
MAFVAAIDALLLPGFGCLPIMKHLVSLTIRRQQARSRDIFLLSNLGTPE